MRNAIGKILVLAAFAALPFGTASAQEKPPIKLALSTPLSGPLGPAGKVQQIAVQIGVADVNKSGGINGSPIELMSFDDQFSPAQGLLRVREAHRADAVVILGPYGSTQWETAVPVLNQLKMPGINMSATKPGINAPPYAFRLSNPDDRGMLAGLDEFVRVNPGLKQVAVMGDVREASGKAAIDNWVQFAKDKNLKVLDTLTYTSQADMSAFAIKLKGLAPDAVLVGMLPADALRLAREMNLQGVKVPLLANGMVYGGVFPQTVTSMVGGDANFWHVVGFTSNEWASGDLAKHKDFVARFIAEVNKDPALSQAQPPNVANSNVGYDAVMLVAEVLRKSGADGRTPVAELREKLKSGIGALKTYKGLNQYFFDASGEGVPKTELLRVDASRGMYVPAAKR
jgi:branched-chain amino acid transport system substrate-binding protein